MTQSLHFVAGMALMALFVAAWRALVAGAQHSLPAATARQLRRAQKARRLELDLPPSRWVREARDHFDDIEEMTR